MIASYKTILTNMHSMSQIEAANALDRLALWYMTLAAEYDNLGNPFAAAYFEEKSAAYTQQSAVILLCTESDWLNTQEISLQFAEAQQADRGSRKYHARKSYRRAAAYASA